MRPTASRPDRHDSGRRLRLCHSLLILLSASGCGGDGSSDATDHTTGLQQTAETPKSTPGTKVPLTAFSRKKRTQITAKDIPPIRLFDVAAEAGLEFQYANGARGQHLMTETTGGGGGWLDFDRDGFGDLFFAQGGDASQPANDSQPGDKLFRNIEGERFIEVTIPAGIRGFRFSQGVAVGDYDGDGFDDVFVTNVGLNRLFRNLGDGTFEDVTPTTGMTTESWSTSAAWGDVDRDGDLDLYVCNYAAYDPLNPLPCLTPSGEPGTCHPKEVDAVPDSYFRNEGDGAFTLLSQELHLTGPGNKALGVVIADVNNDSWPDIFVANDTTPNFLFVSDQAQDFQNLAIALGCAVGAGGHAQASMGVACGDFDRNGFLDFYITHFVHDWNTLYVNLGDQGFHDRTSLLGLATPTMRLLGFGTVMSDFNNDGWLDLLVANGHVDEMREEGVEFEMPAQMFGGRDGRFIDVSTATGDYFDQPRLGRGIITLDFNRDGRLDAVIINQNAPVALLQNDSAPANWLAVELVGRQSPRRGIGARVSIQTEGGSRIHEFVGGSSYASTVQPVAWFGLGSDNDTHTVTVNWPSGLTQTLADVTPNQTLFVVEPDE